MIYQRFIECVCFFFVTLNYTFVQVIMNDDRLTYVVIKVENVFNVIIIFGKMLCYKSLVIYSILQLFSLMYQTLNYLVTLHDNDDLIIGN